MADNTADKTIPCQHCGKELRSGWKSCPYCTMPVAAVDERVTGIVLVSADRGRVSDAGAEIATYRTVDDAYLVSGEVDILVKLAAKSFSELRSFVVDSVGGVRGVRDTRTHMVVHTWKEGGRKAGEAGRGSVMAGKDPVRAVLLLRVEQAKKDQLCGRLSDLGFIEDVYLITGDWDVIVKGCFPSYGAMKRFVGDTVGELDGVKEQKTLMAMEILKERGKLHPDAAKRAIEQPKEISFRLPSSEQEVYSVLTVMPRGLTASLWGMQVDALVAEIMKAEYALSKNGVPVIRLKNKWYFGDLDDPSSYLQPYDGEVLESR